MDWFEIDFKNWCANKYRLRPTTDEEHETMMMGFYDHDTNDFIKPSEEERAAMSEALVPDGEGRLLRPTEEALRRAVDLLVVRKKMALRDLVVKLAPTIGTIYRMGDDLLDWFNLENRIRRMFKRGGSAQSPATVSLCLLPDKKGSIRLALRPTDLRAALLVQASRMIATGTSLQKCEHCTAGFLTGGLGRGKAKKRADARFCSEPCRWAFNNERRRKVAK